MCWQKPDTSSGETRVGGGSYGRPCFFAASRVWAGHDTSLRRAPAEDRSDELRQCWRELAEGGGRWGYPMLYLILRREGDVREKLERWRLDYNRVQPHSALADRSPEEFVREWQHSSVASLCTAGPAKGAPAGAVHFIDAPDPKPIQLSGPPQAEMRGGAEKLSTEGTEQAAPESDLLEVVN
jgi:Integrase core domain